MLQFVVFLLGSVGLFIISRHALAEKTSHGFPRFFAFEAILGLVVLNVPYWFSQPFSLIQLVSWVLLFGAVFLVIQAILVLRAHGAQDKSIQDDSQLPFEKTTHLVMEGPYHFIRHPMYASLLYLAWGVCLKQVTLITVLLLVLACLTLFLTAVYEERENLAKFGDEYAAYMVRTKRFIPYIF
jgi:protein-S-isoprenylcysteine O-methyltransferase Ste14